jgi:chromosome segregation protein
VAAEARAADAVGATLGSLRAADKAAAEASGRLGRLAGAARAAEDEAARLDAAIVSAAQQRERNMAALAELQATLAAAERGPVPQAQPPPESRAREAEPPEVPDRHVLAACASAAREAETDARLEVRTAEERLRAIAGRADELQRAAQAERRAAEAAAARCRLRERQAAAAAAVAEGADIALTRVAGSLAAAQAERDAAEQAGKGRSEALKEIRARARALAADLDAVVTAAHGAEVVRAEQRIRMEQVAERATAEFGVDTAALLAEYGPDVPVPVPDPEPGEVTAHAGASAAGAGGAGGAGVPGAGGAAEAGGAAAAAPEGRAVSRTVPYVRAEQERRAATAQRQLDQLGKVNPLALEEYAALEERHAFLAAQLEDLKKTRRDLLTVVKEVDDRVQEVFTSAFADTAAEFEQIFARLFPGGEGRLILTDPGDMLATGIDVEARPPGKKIKRLSLLSGGERSLTAIAFLLAIFKARPSPFYVLDEVEAALDDTNMQRLLQIFEELRDASQLIIVTHQKRTMEVADALYGTTMQGDGVSAVVSQRLRERERA